MERILISINVRWWNAEAAYAFNLALGLRDAGQQVWLLANPQSPACAKAKEAGLQVIEHILLDEVSFTRQRANYRALLKLIDDLNLTVLHSFKPNGSHLLGWARKKYPHLIHIRTRGEARPPKNHLINRWIYGPTMTDGIMVAGKKVAQWLKPLGLKNQLIELAYYAMPPLPYRQAEKPNPLNLPPGSRLLTLLGRTQPVKGHAELLEAFAQLNEPTAHLLFLVKDLKEFPEVVTGLKKRIAELNLENKVHWTGFIEDLNPWLEATDLAIIPSLGSEINCRAAIEWMNKAVPIVAFPTGSLPEIIEHTHDGYICANYSPSQLMKAIKWFFEKPDRFSICGKNGETTFKAHYQIQSLTQQTLAFYQQVRKERGKEFA